MEEFSISDKAKKLVFFLIGAGLLLAIIGFMDQKDFLHAELKNSASGEHSDDLQGHGDSDHEGEDYILVSYHAHHNQRSPEEIELLRNELINLNPDKYVITVDDVHHIVGHGHGNHVVPGSFEWKVTVRAADHVHAAHGHGHSPTEEVCHAIHYGDVAFFDKSFSRFWSNLLVDGFYFFGVALAALFYLALHYATESGWGVVLKRVMEGVMLAMPLGMIVLLVVLATGTVNIHHIYQFFDPHVVEADEIIQGKMGYLNKPFFWTRTIIYLAIYFVFMKGFRKRSLQEDLEGGTKIHFTNFKKAALFLVFFAVFSTTMSWDWLMSIDVHWFSTLYGWFVFSGMWVSAMIFMLILTLYLKSKGHLPKVNENHIHDLGKWMFAISFLWSYLWFSQFMLIWYSDIPEEVTYFMSRIENYKYLFFGVFLINFIFPMIFLMSREAKRAYGILTVIGLIIFIGHWLDMYLLVAPGTLFEYWEFGMLEIGMFMLFLGVFIFLVLRNLTKAPLEVKNHPYLEESIHHEF